MTNDAIIAYSTAAVAVIGAVGARVADWRKAKSETEATRNGLVSAFVKTLQDERAKLVEEHRAEQAADAARLQAERLAYDAERAGHTKCREEVSALTGRVLVLEGANAALSNDMKRARDRIDAIDRKTSNPAIPAAKEGV